MVNDILKAIEEKTNEETARITDEKKAKLLAIEKEYALSIEEKYEKERDIALKKAAKEIEEFEKALQLKIGFHLQEEKNKIVKAVYEKAFEQIALAEDTEFKRLIKHLSSFVPDNRKGHIESGQRTSKVLKSFVNADIEVKDNLKEEGFIFKSHDIEIDLRISQILWQMQETVNPEIIKILFS